MTTRARKTAKKKKKKKKRKEEEEEEKEEEGRNEGEKRLTETNDRRHLQHSLRPVHISFFPRPVQTRSHLPCSPLKLTLAS